MTDSSNPGTVVHYQDFPCTRIATRPVDVRLPDDYGAAPAYRYPVIYMHDGQFIFDRSTSPCAGTDWLWNVDKTMTRLIREGEIRAAIVVAVWMNDRKKVSRRAEYMPQKILTDEVRQWLISEQQDFDGEEFTSDNYLEFLVEELKPFIDETYRTIRLWSGWRSNWRSDSVAWPGFRWVWLRDQACGTA